jgi:uncharacterized protein
VIGYNGAIEEDTMKFPQGAGGTTGGFGMFFGGLVMAAAGLYMIARSVTLTASLNWSIWGYNVPFGLTLLPLLVGIGFLFYNSRSGVGWVLAVLGTVFILVEVLMSLHIWVRQISLYEGIVMFGLFAGGVGLILRSFRAADTHKQADSAGS